MGPVRALASVALVTLLLGWSERGRAEVPVSLALKPPAVLGARVIRGGVRPPEEPEEPEGPRSWYGDATLTLDVAAMLTGFVSLNLEYSDNQDRYGGRYGDGSHVGWWGLFIPFVGAHTFWVIDRHRLEYALVPQIATAGSALGVPLVHLERGHAGRAAASLAIRALPITVAAATCPEDGFWATVSCGTFGVAAVLSYPVAVILDSSAFATEPTRTTWDLVLVPRTDGAALSIGRPW